MPFLRVYFPFVTSFDTFVKFNLHTNFIRFIFDSVFNTYFDTLVKIKHKKRVK